MTSKKNLFKISKLRKRKKSLPAGKIRSLKHFFHSYENMFKRGFLVLATLLGMWLVYGYQTAGLGYLFKASVLETHQPFTGTVMPIDKVPNWSNWDGDNHTDSFTGISANMLTALPSYDLGVMQFPDESLVWGKSEHDIIRNTKITYPVVYLGNYQFDHKENSGSHLAVDIKMPVGTPVKNIANGVVSKVSMTETGFGHHIVVEHRNVPDPDKPGKKTTLYSAFNHLDKIYVKQGDVVNKGKLIATSGNTGTSTTPHLHFQIDTASAPWHPYWPFSWSESQDAGLSFFEAVNAGLGLSNAKQHTINPMVYIRDHLNYSGSDDSTPVVETETVVEVEEPEVEVIEVEVIEEDPVVEVIETPDESNVDPSLFDLDIRGEKVSMVNNGVTLIIEDKKNQIEKMTDSDTLKVVHTGVGRVSKKVFKRVDFNSNTIKVILNSSDTGTARVEVGKTIFEVQFIDKVQPISSLDIKHDGKYQRNQVEVIEVVALGMDGNPTPAVVFSGTIEIKAKEGEAKFSPDRLAVNDFVNGVATVRMTVSNENPVLVRAQNGAIIGESQRLYAESIQTFKDVGKGHPNYEAIKQLEEYNIIGGYSDGTFKPDNTVNRVEALKMLMLAFEIESGPDGLLPFQDTDEAAWYANTLATAVDREIVKGYSDGTFKPGSTVNKAEYLKMLFLTNGIEPNDNLKANPYSDVPKDSWYAPYAYLTNKRNLLDVNNNRLEAGNGMTRGDVAETIFRMMYLLDNDVLTYNR